MTVKGKDIVAESGNFWIHRDTKKNCYHVMKIGVTMSTSDSSYPLTEDGFSIAEARMKYLSNRFPKE